MWPNSLVAWVSAAELETDAPNRVGRVLAASCWTRSALMPSTAPAATRATETATTATHPYPRRLVRVRPPASGRDCAGRLATCLPECMRLLSVRPAAGGTGPREVLPGPRHRNRVRALIRRSAVTRQAGWSALQLEPSDITTAQQICNDADTLVHRLADAITNLKFPRAA
jgi:hypothetical protein